MNRLESLALAIADMNGAFTPGSTAFKLKNPGLLKTWRPEKKADSEHFRIFTSVMGGFKALIADMQAKSTGLPHKLTPENPLRDLLVLYGISTGPAVHKITLFLRKAIEDENIGGGTPISWFLEDILVVEEK
jgi:hypothetical protein